MILNLQRKLVLKTPSHCAGHEEGATFNPTVRAEVPGRGLKKIILRPITGHTGIVKAVFWFKLPKVSLNIQLLKKNLLPRAYNDPKVDALLLGVGQFAKEQLKTLPDAIGNDAP